MRALYLFLGALLVLGCTSTESNERLLDPVDERMQETENPVNDSMQASPEDHDVKTPVEGPRNSELPLSRGEYETESMDVEYFENTTGYLAKPVTGDYPGIVMIHEWWGLNDNIRDMADILASHGYTVLAVDLYGGKTTITSDEARTLVSSVDQNRSISNMKAAMQYLRSQGSAHIASLGWCFGGGQSMQLALSGEQLDATVIYYGNLVTDPAALEKIKWPVLGIFGMEDTSIPVSVVNNFSSSLNNLSIKNEIYVYPEAGHAFANPSGNNFAVNETLDSWNRTISFLDMNLK